MVSYIKGGTQSKGVWKQIPKAKIGAQEGENGEWRRLDNEERHSLYRSPNIVRVIKSHPKGHVARMEQGGSSFQMLTGKPTAKRPLGQKQQLLDGRTVENKSKLILTEIFPSVQKHYI